MSDKGHNLCVCRITLKFVNDQQSEADALLMNFTSELSEFVNYWHIWNTYSTEFNFYFRLKHQVIY